MSKIPPMRNDDNLCMSCHKTNVEHHVFPFCGSCFKIIGSWLSWMAIHMQKEMRPMTQKSIQKMMRELEQND